MITNTHSLALLTDLYQLTMAQGYWKTGMDRHEAVFHLFFRRNPFKGAYSIACGLADAVDFIQNFRFDESDRAYLATLEGNDGKPLFEPAFLDYLGDLQLTCDLDAIPEGTVVFPQEPLLRVQGPLLQCQLLETPLLTIINFQTLIATKAARVCHAAQGDPVLEFGLRRAQGMDGGLSASRAAYIGGCAGTSNVLAGKLYGIPVKGTHAHSWIMSFDTEQESFEAYAQAMPNNCIFLVDTYDTIEGVKRAIDAGRRLKAAGHEMIGIRLDSGDLTALSIEARNLLDEAGFENAAIVGSNDLDEYRITDIKKRGGKIAVWGVGTRLATAYDEPALTGVYKLSAIREPGDPNGSTASNFLTIPPSPPHPASNKSAASRKTAASKPTSSTTKPIPQPTPGKPATSPIPTAEITLPPDCESEDLLQPILRKGNLQSAHLPIEEMRTRCLNQLDTLPVALRRSDPKNTYPVGLETSLHRLKTKLTAANK